jgi:hypothetical protein
MIFEKSINIERITLQIENSNISISIQKIISSGSNCEITFNGDLSLEETATLEAIITRHKPFPLEDIDTSVTARQIRTAMVMSGISIDDIETALDNLPEPTKEYANIAWKYSYRFHRDNPMVMSLTPAMGLTAEDLDDLWTLARSV